jgi:hypothetical protein
MAMQAPLSVDHPFDNFFVHLIHDWSFEAICLKSNECVENKQNVNALPSIVYCVKNIHESMQGQTSNYIPLDANTAALHAAPLTLCAKHKVNGGAQLPNAFHAINP